MTQLEHINLVITNLDDTLKFYQAAFPHWKIRSKGHGEWFGKARTWVHFGDDYQYLAFNEFGEGKNRDRTGHQVGLMHFAYLTDNIEALIERMVHAGFAIDNPGTEEPFRRNVYFVDPDGFEVEFVQYFSDNPAERNLQPEEVSAAARATDMELTT